jgi:hypothetical protein
MSFTRSVRAFPIFLILVTGSFMGATTAAAAAPAPVGRGTASDFAVLGGSTVTNTGPSVLTGNLGLSLDHRFSAGKDHGVVEPRGADPWRPSVQHRLAGREFGDAGHEFIDEREHPRSDIDQPEHRRDGRREHSGPKRRRHARQQHVSGAACLGAPSTATTAPPGGGTTGSVPPGGGTTATTRPPGGGTTATTRPPGGGTTGTTRPDGATTTDTIRREFGPLAATGGMAPPRRWLGWS